MKIRVKKTAKTRRRARPVFDPPYRIDPGGDWRACTPTLPRGCAVLGTVTVGPDTGALARLAGSGNYVRVSDGRLHALNQRQVDTALQLAAAKTHAPAMIPIAEWERER
jgi:hypothetical protein